MVVEDDKKEKKNAIFLSFARLKLYSKGTSGNETPNSNFKFDVNGKNNGMWKRLFQVLFKVKYT